MHAPTDRRQRKNVSTVTVSHARRSLATVDALCARIIRVEFVRFIAGLFMMHIVSPDRVALHSYDCDIVALVLLLRPR